MEKILVTGGAGYIGSQICKLLKKTKMKSLSLIIFQQEKNTQSMESLLKEI